LARALSEIEIQKGQKSKDVIKEIIANVFRSAILLSPNELGDLFYFFCIKLAPDYEGLETGIGHEILLKSVAKACGKSPTQIREQFKKEGDLGLVAQLGKAT
jgi:DNA ligase-1